ncbi:hypothetical protein OG863_00055 [Streptomyces decoyicus]|uniref:Uncharacterized protein n=1 Tax=Streptomyces decoyicus TaxID=249567 RepID=A0ABZ1F861_9ACTN|nr:hypothetical protein [Streptomyces decoyicus]WSB66508.1 hypothetical protein OG863_00055 [Streptomyces decoyicus]
MARSYSRPLCSPRCWAAIRSGRTWLPPDQPGPGRLVLTNGEIAAYRAQMARRTTASS